MPKFEVVTDHKPLLGIFEKQLDDIDNSRIQRYRMKLLSYNFKVRWVAGKTHLIADALSRAPIFESLPDESNCEENSYLFSCFTTTEDPKLQRLIKEASSDKDYRAIILALSQDKVLKNLPPTHPARQFSSVWDRLSLFENQLLVYDNDRIVVPKAVRQDILKMLHSSHSGIVKMRKGAQQLYFWPGMNNDIKMLIEKCTKCQSLRPSSQKETLQPTTATEAMEQISADLFEYAGRHYLVMVD
jgi:hypothetical protein